MLLYKVFMFNNIDIKPKEQILLIYILLAATTLAVYWQVRQFDFVSFDDNIYVSENIYIKSGISGDGISWSFNSASKKYGDLYHPLIWLSLMLDYELYGMNAGAFHMTNLILHILSTLLLFWLFYRMTGERWKSTFIAAFFALHPLHVESVVWISERKDVLSAFFWMLTLCLYVYYTEKPAVKRYLLVLVSFILTLMSKPMVVTLPVIMMLLDYWPMKRFQNQKGLPHLILWQTKEKLPLMMLSAVLVVISFYNPNGKESLLKAFPLSSRLANAPVAFITYLEKTFWPHDLAILYPFDAHMPAWQVLGAVLIIATISFVVIMAFRKIPYLCVGWCWFVIAILPVIGIIQISLSTPYSMADRYHYLPSIGLAVMMAWGLPLLLPQKDIQKKILFPAGIIFLVSMSIFSWKQCGYWENSIDLWSHALKITKNNYVAHHSRGTVYTKLGQYKLALEDYNEAIRFKPDFFELYYKRGYANAKLGHYQRAIEDYNTAIRLNSKHADTLIERGVIYGEMNQHNVAIKDFNEAIRLNYNNAEAYNNRGFSYFKLGQNTLAIKDYSKAISIKIDYTKAYINRGIAYFKQGNVTQGCRDAQTACVLGQCEILEAARIINYCQ